MALNKAAKKWVEALRSGKYKQGKGKLHDTATDSYCCLGVAEVELGANPADMNRCYLSPDTEKVLGLSDNAGTFRDAQGLHSLAYLNDNKEYTFEQIAILIESEPEGLFRGAVPDATGASDSENTK